MLSSSIQLNNPVKQSPSSNSLSFKGRINVVKLSDLSKEEYKAVTESLDKKDLKAVKALLKYFNSCKLRLKFALFAPKNEVINVRFKKDFDSCQTSLLIEHNGAEMYPPIDNQEIRLLGRKVPYEYSKNRFKHICKRYDQFVNDVIQSLKPKKP
jgi:hypothetical protein